MGAGDFRGDIKAQAESLLAGSYRGASKRPKQTVYDVGRDGFAMICDSELKADDYRYVHKH